MDPDLDLVLSVSNTLLRVADPARDYWDPNSSVRANDYSEQSSGFGSYF